MHLGANGFGNNLFIVWNNIRIDRLPFLGCGFDGAEIANPGEAHVERARNRCGGHRDEVDLFAQLFQVFFGGDAKALFFVDDDEAEIFKVHIF